MAADDTSRRDAEQWKSKYHEQKETLKQKDKEWRDADSALRRGISRLTFAIGGIDPQLDKLLARLRDAIRENHTTQAVVDLINNVSDLVKKLDDRKAGSDAETDSARTLALAILRDLQFPDSQRKRARKLLQQYEDDRADGDELQSQLAQLLHDSMVVASAGHEGGGGGLFERVLSAFHKAPDASGASTPPDANALPLDHARQLLLHLMQRSDVPVADSAVVKSLLNRLATATDSAEFDAIVSEYSAIANAAPTGAPAPASVTADDGTAPPVHEILIQFIEQLTIPPEFQDEANRIKEQLAAQSNDAAFTAGFRSIVNLVTNMRRSLVREKLELQEFLQQLTQRLQDLDQHLGGAQTHQQTWVAEGKKLEVAVQTQVHDIKVTVNDASDLPQLKAAIQQRLDVLQAHLDDYQRNEEQRQSQLATELSLVKSRLTNVEHEADQLRTRLKDKHQQTIIDPLTGVHNRLAYDERVISEVARWKRYRSPLALLVLDVDHFKRINDQYGHKAGDKALKLIAQVLKENLRETDFLARYGGEEFVVLVTETADDSVPGVTEKLRGAIEHCEFHYAGRDVPITISCGYTMFRDGDTAETAFNRADAALYKAKEQGRNRCCAD